MWRTGLLGVVLLGLAAGCRSSYSDRCGLVRRDNLASRIGCREPDRAACAPCAPGLPASYGQPVSLTPDEMLTPATDAVVPNGGFGFPVYPGGEPMPLRPGPTGPANELPYPNIPAPGVPENPAQPMPAIPQATTSLPSSTAHTTGESRKSK
jgi:hypothetical protein